MKIRHCKKCGTGVLDENQTQVGPFHCRRCRETLPSEPDPPAPPEPVKVEAVPLTCPSCFGSFLGKKPARPAKGTCPLCRKPLILFPTGDLATETQHVERKTKQDAGSTIVVNQDANTPPVPKADLPAAPPKGAREATVVPQQDTKPSVVPSSDYGPTRIQQIPSAESPKQVPAPKAPVDRTAAANTPRVPVRPPATPPPPIPKLPVAPKDGILDYVCAAILFLLPFLGIGASIFLMNRPRIQEGLSRFGSIGQKGLPRLQEEVERRLESVETRKEEE